jgi:hypothetical protein
MFHWRWNKLQKDVSGVTRYKPEEIIITWMHEKDIPRNWHACDLCNRDLDWEPLPFPAVHFPTEEELADPEYVPIPEGGRALCKSCAEKEYGLEPKDRRRVKRMWYCYNLVIKEKYSDEKVTTPDAKVERDISGDVNTRIQ